MCRVGFSFKDKDILDVSHLKKSYDRPRTQIGSLDGWLAGICSPGFDHQRARKSACLVGWNAVVSLGEG